MKRNNWNLQLVRIQEKGMAARRAGLSLADCPYGLGRSGGNLQRQRREYWHIGWNDENERQAALSLEGP